MTATIGSKLEQAEIERVRRKPTESLDAYDCYLHGLATLDRLKIRTVDEALTLFSNAIELDPRFAKAYALAAYCRALRLASPGHIADREEEQAEAERLARHAARLGTDDAAALSAAAMALIFASRDFDVSIALIERALIINPNLGHAWTASGFARLCNGEPELAIVRLEYAMRLSPFDPEIGVMWHAIAFSHLLAGRYDRSLWASEQGLANNVHDLSVLAASSALAGDMDKARRVGSHSRARFQPPHFDAQGSCAASPTRGFCQICRRPTTGRIARVIDPARGVKCAAWSLAFSFHNSLGRFKYEDLHLIGGWSCVNYFTQQTPEKR